MKNDAIQQMTDRYREGSLDDRELSELGRLAHRDEVMAAAERRAGGILRRRRTVHLGVAGLLLAGGVAWTLLAPHRQEAPLVAEAALPATAAAAPAEPSVAAAVSTADVAPSPATAAAPRTKATSASPRPHTADARSGEEPVVVCNNQCEADSVINDIWKFLTA